MSYDMENHEALTLAGISLTTNNQAKDCVQKIMGLWDKLLNQNTLANIPNKTGLDVLYGLYHSYAGGIDDDYTLTVGPEVYEIDEKNVGHEIKYLIIPQAKYAVFTASNRDKIADTWVDIWNTPLDRTFLFDFEKCDQRNEQVLIYIGIK